MLMGRQCPRLLAGCAFSTCPVRWWRVGVLGLRLGLLRALIVDREGLGPQRGGGHAGEFEAGMLSLVTGCPAGSHAWLRSRKLVPFPFLGALICVPAGSAARLSLRPLSFSMNAAIAAGCACSKCVARVLRRSRKLRLRRLSVCRPNSVAICAAASGLRGIETEVERTVAAAPTSLSWLAPGAPLRMTVGVKSKGCSRAP